MIPAQRSTADTDLDELRARRSRLADELQRVRYWRRVARAQTDLLVASLLYAGHGDLDGQHAGTAAPAERLVLLREREQRMSSREDQLRGDLDAVTRELVDGVIPRPAGSARPGPVGAPGPM